MPSLRPSWEICSAQEMGGRIDQQDAGGAWRSAEGESVLAVLADGAGGHEGGARAARAAVAAARELWENEAVVRPSVEFLEKISRAAHEAIRNEFRGAKAARATWVALLATETEAHWVHSGDSRLYHLAGGEVVARTRDHSVAQLMIDRGKLRPGEVPSPADRSTLLQSLGTDDYVAVEADSARLRGGDLFVLCTDGVWNGIEDGDLRRLAGLDFSRRQRLATKIVRQAVERGGAEADNGSLWCVARAS